MQIELRPRVSLIRNRYKCRVIGLRNAHCKGGEVMERQEGQFELNDLGLVIFAIVAGWFLLFQSGLF